MLIFPDREIGNTIGMERHSFYNWFDNFYHHHIRSYKDFRGERGNKDCFRNGYYWIDYLRDHLLFDWKRSACCYHRGYSLVIFIKMVIWNRLAQIDCYCSHNMGDNFNCGHIASNRSRPALADNNSSYRISLGNKILHSILKILQLPAVMLNLQEKATAFNVYLILRLTGHIKLAKQILHVIAILHDISILKIKS